MLQRFLPGQKNETDSGETSAQVETLDATNASLYRTVQLEKKTTAELEATQAEVERQGEKIKNAQKEVEAIAYKKDVATTKLSNIFSSVMAFFRSANEAPPPPPPSRVVESAPSVRVDADASKQPDIKPMLVTGVLDEGLTDEELALLTMQNDTMNQIAKHGRVMNAVTAQLEKTLAAQNKSLDVLGKTTSQTAEALKEVNRRMKYH